jgi:hypothetical protein
LLLAVALYFITARMLHELAAMERKRFRIASQTINDLGALKTGGYEEGSLCTDIYSSAGRIFARFF